MNSYILLYIIVRPPDSKLVHILDTGDFAARGHFWQPKVHAQSGRPFLVAKIGRTGFGVTFQTMAEGKENTHFYRCLHDMGPSQIGAQGPHMNE